MTNKRIALVAHDNLKPTLLSWCETHSQELARHELWATGHTGGLLEERLGLAISRFRSGPMGGDVQIASRIVEGQLDALIFFWDPLAAMPHEADVQALLRIAVLHDTPLACNRSTADAFMATLRTGTRFQARPRLVAVS